MVAETDQKHLQLIATVKSEFEKQYSLQGIIQGGKQKQYKIVTQKPEHFTTAKLCCGLCLVSSIKHKPSLRIIVNIKGSEEPF